MKSQDQIKLALRQFTGSQTFTRYSPVLFPDVVLTEGAEYVADECGAYWLMDMISSHLPSLPAEEYWGVVILTVDDGKALFTLADDSPATKGYAMKPHTRKGRIISNPKPGSYTVKMYGHQITGIVVGAPK